MEDHRGNPSAAKVRPDVNCSDPGRILGAMNAVVFDHAATTNWFVLSQSDHAIRHCIQFPVGPEPVENSLGRVASLAPPLFVDPASNGLDVLWALRQLLKGDRHSPEHCRLTKQNWSPASERVHCPQREGVSMSDVSRKATRFRLQHPVRC